LFYLNPVFLVKFCSRPSFLPIFLLFLRKFAQKSVPRGMVLFDSFFHGDVSGDMFSCVARFPAGKHVTQERTRPSQRNLPDKMKSSRRNLTIPAPGDY
jgi:hypothetical protein